MKKIIGLCSAFFVLMFTFSLSVPAASAAGYLSMKKTEQGPIKIKDKLSPLVGPVFNAININAGSQGEEAGTSVASAGDVNGDGYQDMLIGAPYADFSNGKAYLVLGAKKVINNLNQAEATFTHPDASRLGHKVAGAGDVNGDGYDDLLIASMPMYNDTEGHIYIVYGPVSGNVDLSTQADADIMAPLFNGSSGFEFKAMQAAPAGDVNGDGYDDILAYGDALEDLASRVYLFYGPFNGNLDATADADATFYENSGSYGLGRFAYEAGDVNGDGYGDVYISMPNKDEGTVKLYYGPLNGNIDVDDPAVQATSYVGENEDDFAGYPVKTIGDINNDGNLDMMVNASLYEGDHEYTGALYIIYGPLTTGKSLSQADMKIEGESYTQFFYMEIDAVGDMNQDGFGEVLIGMPGYEYYPVWNTNGEAYLLDGAKLASGGTRDIADSYLKKYTGQYGDQLGMSIAGLGDVNGDQKNDFMIGQPGTDVYGNSSGTARLYLLK